MLTDGVRLASGSKIERSLLGSQRGTSLPVTGNDGDEFQLTVRSNDDAPGIYGYTNGEWVLKYPNNDVLPYDVVAGTLGTIKNGATIGRHLAVRSFTIATGFEFCKALALVPAASNTTFSISKINRSGFSSEIGTVYFAASEAVGIFTQVGNGSIDILTGEQVVFSAPPVVDQFISDVSIVLAGTLM